MVYPAALVAKVVLAEAGRTQMTEIIFVGS